MNPNNRATPFPLLHPDIYQSIKMWLEQQQHESLAQHHTYAACGNTEMSKRYESYGSCYGSILMNMKYNVEGADNG